jgi:hypothetical protein
LKNKGRIFPTKLRNRAGKKVIHNILSSVVDPDPESDPKLFAGSGSGVGFGINHFGSGSGQPLSGMNLKQNFSDKIHNFSKRLCIRFPI